MAGCFCFSIIIFDRLLYYIVQASLEFSIFLSTSIRGMPHHPRQESSQPLYIHPWNSVKNIGERELFKSVFSEATELGGGASPSEVKPEALLSRLPPSVSGRQGEIPLNLCQGEWGGACKLLTPTPLAGWEVWAFKAGPRLRKPGEAASPKIDFLLICVSTFRLSRGLLGMCCLWAGLLAQEVPKRSKMG